MTHPGDDGLLKSCLNSSINLYVSRSKPLLVCTVGRLFSSWSKPLKEVTTQGKCILVICWLEVHIFSEDGPIDLVSKEFWVCQGCDHMLTCLIV